MSHHNPGDLSHLIQVAPPAPLPPAPPLPPALAEFLQAIGADSNDSSDSDVGSEFDSDSDSDGELIDMDPNEDLESILRSARQAFEQYAFLSLPSPATTTTNTT